MRYINNNILKTNEGKRYLNSNLYPLISPKSSDIYIITGVGDRLDIIANDFYKNPLLWWVIAASNNIRKDSIFITPGTQLRIPTDLEFFNTQYSKINNK